MTPQEIRETLEGLPCPICTKGATDEQLEQLNKDIDVELYSRFGTSDTTASDKVAIAWWSALESFAIEEYGMMYYEDIEYDNE